MFKKTEPHPFSDVLESLIKAAAMDPSRGSAKLIGTSEKDYSINDIINEIRKQTAFGIQYAESHRKLQAQAEKA